MPINLVLPIISTIIMFIFAALVFRRYLARRSGGWHLLVWGVGLTMFAVAVLAEFILGLTWNEVAFRSWYLFGAILTAAWIGQGTMHLLFRRPWVKVLTAVLAVVSIGVALWLWLTPVDPSAFQAQTPISVQYGDILPKGAPIRLSSIPFNIYGTITLVGGALWSAYLFWRKRVMGNRVMGNIIIAAGALSIASASTLARLGFGAYLYIGELIAAIAMFAGFIIASRRVHDSLESEPLPARATAARSA